MEQLQLLNSIVQQVSGNTVTLFVGSLHGRCGLVAAGTWETLLPFRFDAIQAADGCLTVLAEGKERSYRIVHDQKGLRAVKLPAKKERAIHLPA